MSTQKSLEALLPDQTMAVVGAAGGDEGKGKIVDLLTPHYSLVARYSGGANAGHTIYTLDLLRLVSHLIPCSLARGIPAVIARGVFFDAARFIAERNEARRVLGEGRMPPILVDHACTLWTPYHALFETWCEDQRGASPIGTTGRAIGPMAAIRDLRCDLKVADLDSPQLLEKVQLLYRVLEPLLLQLQRCRQQREAKYHVTVPTPEEVTASLGELAGEIMPHVRDTRLFLYRAYKHGERILFEASQAAMLDLMHGTNPYVSSGMTLASGVAQGTGLPFDALRASCLVTKVMPTRVGEGPMPSEFWDRHLAEDYPKQHPELFRDGKAREAALTYYRDLINRGVADGEAYSHYFQILGLERGASTGRGRSPGAMDLPWLEYAKQLNAPKFLALTRFDMLSGLDRVPVVTAYCLGGDQLTAGEFSPSILPEVTTVQEQWSGWQESIAGCHREEDLPKGARCFIDRIENVLELHVGLVGTGPAPADIIVR